MLYAVSTEQGRFVIEEKEGAVVSLLLRSDREAPEQAPTPLLAEAGRQLRDYLAGRRRVFELPLAAEGTVFEQAVWQALLTIPYGETRTYAEIARAVGRPRACRAVGMANQKNPLPILIPCHRVVGQSGKLTGYAGGLEMKRALLALENT